MRNDAEDRVNFSKYENFIDLSDEINWSTRPDTTDLAETIFAAFELCYILASGFHNL